MSFVSKVVRKEVKVVAEMGASHHQNYETAVQIVEAAKWAGADALKVQLFTPDQMTLRSRDPQFIIKDGLWRGFPLWDLYEATAMPLDWFSKLKEHAEALGLQFFASVYHPDMVIETERLGNPIYKIASYENGFTDLLTAVAKTGKPVIISTGSADFTEIKEAVKTVAKEHKNRDKITLLHCVSQYPAQLENMNLKTILALKKAFKCDVGLSDHTESSVAAALSVALGASVIEKHIRVDDIGLDTFAAMPVQFKAMVEIIRAAEKALGKCFYGGERQFRRKLIEGKMLRTV